MCKIKIPSAISNMHNVDNCKAIRPFFRHFMAYIKSRDTGFYQKIHYFLLLLIESFDTKNENFNRKVNNQKSTIRPVYNGHPWDPQKEAAVQRLRHRWSLFTVYQYKILKNWSSSWPLQTCGRCSEVAVNTGMTVHIFSQTLVTVTSINKLDRKKYQRFRF